MSSIGSTTSLPVPKGTKNARVNVGVSCIRSTIAIAVQNTTLQQGSFLFEINPRFSFNAASLPDSTLSRTYALNLAAKAFGFLGFGVRSLILRFCAMILCHLGKMHVLVQTAHIM